MAISEYIDLRSDTVTKPSAEMLEVMMSARVGDDVFGEDPTVNLLEERSATLFGMEAGLFVPSGTMANQIAIRLNTSLQDEIICDKLSHVYYYEGGGTFSNSGVSIRLVDGDRGRITARQVVENINDPESNYLAVSSLVCIENTCNKGGGSYYSLNDIKEIGNACRENNLKFHIDGARIFNAVVETREPTAQFVNHTDTLSFCFSKGLGAPIGSILVSSKKNIIKARRIRKAFGGGMRQAGYLAAACMYALENNIPKLKTDHLRARAIGEALKNCHWVESVMPVDTNIIVFRVSEKLSVQKIIDALYEKGIKAVPFGKNDIRMVTHLDITDSMLDHIITVLPKMRL